MFVVATRIDMSILRIVWDGLLFKHFGPVRLAEAVGFRLAWLIQKRIQKLALREPACSIVIAYDDEGNDMFPPAIGVGTERERAQWLQRGGEDTKDRIWNPAGFENYARGDLDLNTDVILSAMCQRLNRHIRDNEKWAAGRTLLASIATHLRSINWNRMLPIANEFVVYEVDLEMARLNESLRNAVGDETVDQWRQRQLVR